MSIEETKEAIRVMQSFVDGNEVEYQISDGTWCDALTPSWNWASARYRIKPTPLRCARELEHELKAANSKIEALNRGNANAERILCELTGCESGRDVPDWIVKKNWELTDLAKAYLELVHKHTLANERIKRLEEAGDAMDPMNDTECECDSGYVVVCKHCFDRSTNWRKAKEVKP